MNPSTGHARPKLTGSRLGRGESSFGETFSTIHARKERMSEINRSLIILRPRQPFLDWVCSLYDESKDLTLESLNEDSTVYLIPEIWEDSDREEFLKTCYDILFEEQLEGWWTDEIAWPQQRDLKMFLDWFEVEFHSLVFDLCDEPIRIVEDEEDSEYPATGNSPYTHQQGQYLAFIFYYTKLHGRAPAEAEMQTYFNVSPPSVHQMILTLERNRLIERTPGQARSIRLLLARGDLPDLE